MEVVKQRSASVAYQGLSAV